MISRIVPRTYTTLTFDNNTRREEISVSVLDSTKYVVVSFGNHDATFRINKRFVPRRVEKRAGGEDRFSFVAEDSLS